MSIGRPRWRKHIPLCPANRDGVTLAVQWFPARLFPLLAALTEMAGMVGEVVGQEVTRRFDERIPLLQPDSAGVADASKRLAIHDA